MRKFPPRRFFFLSLLFLAMAGQLAQAQDYNLEGYAWPEGATVTMQLQLGSGPVALQDASGSWNNSAADAWAIWDGYVELITLASVRSSEFPGASGDGKNSAFFASTIFGDRFGEDTLAVTVLLDNGSNVTTEADVVVNSAFRFDSYRGPAQPEVYDFHRIMLHEFGHVLGLAHVQLNPGGKVIMEPVIGDVDHPAPDDIAGVRSLYGAEFYFPRTGITLPVGYFLFIEDLNATNNPTSFSATGLPPGITLNNNGRLEGSPTTSGVFNSVITAHGPIVDVYTPYQFTILGIEEVQGLLAILPTRGVSSIAADPLRPRLYVAGWDGISMVDTETFEVTNLLPGFMPSLALSISADATALLCTAPSMVPAEEFKIDLETLQKEPAFSIPGGYSEILEGLQNRAYIAGPTSVFQFDATNGAEELSFSPASTNLPGAPGLAIAPDRATLYVAHTAGAPEAQNLSSYNIAGPEPKLLHRLSGFFYSLTPSRDGLTLYGVKGTPDGQSLVQVQLPSFGATTRITSAPNLGATSVGLNGRIYQPILPANPGEYLEPSGSFAIFDPATLEQTFNLQIGGLQGDSYPLVPGNVAFEPTGKYCFAEVTGFYGTDVWVLSTDPASYPPPIRATKNLVNISTRVRVAAGEDSAIGGFIIQGPAPKRVMLRGLGPSLPLTGAMSDPVLDLYDSKGKLLASNDNWISDRLNIVSTRLAPSSEREASLSLSLLPGDYTAVVRDRNNQPGLALVEIYDLEPKASRLANISTRGKVEAGDNIMIGGFIIGNAEPARMLLRAIGPSLASKGIAQPLADPVLELHDGDGNLISTNDSWRGTQPAEIIATGIPPTDDREAAIVATLPPGNYTAIVRGKNGTTGVALVEVYNLEAGGSQ